VKCCVEYLYNPPMKACISPIVALRGELHCHMRYHPSKTYAAEFTRSIHTDHDAGESASGLRESRGYSQMGHTASCSQIPNLPNDCQDLQNSQWCIGSDSTPIYTCVTRVCLPLYLRTSRLGPERCLPNTHPSMSVLSILCPRHSKSAR
jgi:hypothetical protein